MFEICGVKFLFDIIPKYRYWCMKFQVWYLHSRVNSGRLFKSVSICNFKLKHKGSEEIRRYITNGDKQKLPLM